MEKFKASCTVKNFGLIAGWISFESENLRIICNSGWRVNTLSSFLSGSNAITFCGTLSQDVGVA